jgi:hypothetical protein
MLIWLASLSRTAAVHKLSDFSELQRLLLPHLILCRNFYTASHPDPFGTGVGRKRECSIT